MVATYGKAAAGVLALHQRDGDHELRVLTKLSARRANKLWICMEFCGGGSLQDVYHGKNPSEESLHDSINQHAVAVSHVRQKH